MSIKVELGFNKNEYGNDYNVVWVFNSDKPQPDIVGEVDWDGFNMVVAEEIRNQVGYEAALISNWIECEDGIQCEFTKAEYLQD